MGTEAGIRHSAIAGRWYPGSAPALRRTVNEYLDAAPAPALPGRLLALIAPHAGYAYSGSTAAHAFALLRGTPFSRVVLFGPLHRPIFGSSLGAYMVPAEAAYRTPLGDVPIDRAFLSRLGERVTLTPVRGDEEHSLEIELPFLQAVLPSFSLVPVMFGDHIAGRGVAEQLEVLADALAAVWDEHTVLVVSTDLTHADNYERVVRADAVLADHLRRFDIEGLTRALVEERAQACGATGLIAALKACRRLGAQGVTLLAQTTSGDVTGDRRPGSYTVGYLSAVVHG